MYAKTTHHFALFASLMAMLMLVSCGDDGFRECVIAASEVSYEGAQGGKVLRSVYHHDGVQYTAIDGYQYDTGSQSYPATPSYTVRFQYQGDRLSEMRVQYMGSSEYDLYRFTYQQQGELTRMERQLSRYRGETELFTLAPMPFTYVERPTDQVVMGENMLGEYFLYVFENGNMVKLGFESPTGTYRAFDRTWHFPIEYKYDNRPNPLASIAIRYYISMYYLASPPNFGLCINNMVEELYVDTDPPISRRNSYELLDGRWLTKWTYHSTGRTVSFELDCR